jgi:hypothetical protein
MLERFKGISLLQVSSTKAETLSVLRFRMSLSFNVTAFSLNPFSASLDASIEENFFLFPFNYEKSSYSNLNLEKF